ncbi:MAG: nucleoside triphosphate pyrophosphohydrolase [Candidatus Wallbacteria bacterium]|nr:nucleoside triphosphate pyrophosphohydrolase [Candidatus Wallbacteria bacterium]
MDKLLEVMKRLRAPGGCPWDRVQTIKSLRPYLLEETYEVLDAMEEGDYRKLCEELGDLLMQIVFQAEIAEDEGKFTFSDVAQGITEKMINRHPHVFENMTLNTPEEVVNEWDKFKSKEGKKGIFEGVPGELPALLQAEKYQRRAKRIGLEFESGSDVIGKLKEELSELEKIYQKGSTDDLEEEFGDVLFSIVNLGRFLEINPELSLLSANRKFKQRVEQVDSLLGKEPERQKIEADPHLLDVLWNKAKKTKKGGESSV